MKHIVYIGVDDTDILGEPPGTGRVARELAEHLESLGLGKSLGVSRHQLLVDPRIPYTSHNSSLCIGMETNRDAAAFEAPCTEYVLAHAKPGSDPGLCICAGDSVVDDAVKFGLRATSEVLLKQEAVELAAQSGIFLKELGGTGGGVIGALAGAALRAEGNHGRFVELRGIRQIDGRVTAAELKQTTAIEMVLDMSGNAVADTESIESYGWIRPSLWRGKAVLRVQPLAGIVPPLWEPVENRKDKPKKKQEANT